MNLSNEFAESRITKPASVILTERDLEIFQFVCEMKFARTEDIYQKFFKNLKSGEVAVSDLWTRKRLFQLEKGGFLKGRKLPGEKSTFYTATNKAFFGFEKHISRKGTLSSVLNSGLQNLRP